MIFHLSIEADDPRHVAAVIVEILGGEAMPFPPVGEGSWLAHSGDSHGSGIEVYPRGTRLKMAEGDADAYGVIESGTPFSATHFAIATELSSDQIRAIAAREGWPIKYRKRGDMFGVLELWIEGCCMIEVLTPEMQSEYLETMTIDNWKRMLNSQASTGSDTISAN